MPPPRALLLLTLSLTVVPTRAQAAPSDRTTARLEYTRKPGAESCLDESGLRIEVARRSGYDPFTSDARARLVVTITSYQFLPDPPYPTPPKADPPAPPTPPKRTHYPLCDESEKQNEAVNVALGGLTVPLATLNEARTKRDAAIPDWEKHFRRLKEETGT